MPERMKRAEKYRFEKDRLLCMGGGFLMLYVVGIRDESEIREGQYGKPFAPGYPAFNFSHSGEWCILVKGEGEIGVDIEKIDENKLSAAPTVYTPPELAWMNEEPLERFYRLWTWKESLIKALGTGMSLEPKTFEVLPFMENQPIRMYGQLWYAASGSIPGYRFSVCSSSPLGSLKWMELCLSDF
jgi:4'-phosphopantetheinyl transferase